MPAFVNHHPSGNIILPGSFAEAGSLKIPLYPDFIPLSLELYNEVQPLLALLTDGISEFTFSNLFLFRNRYQYRIALLPGGLPEPQAGLIISGISPIDQGKFFMSPCGFPGAEILKHLFETHDYWKNIPPSLFDSLVNGVPAGQYLETQGITISDDRENFDYLYLRSELAALSGKKFHKKKNLVNAFMKAWPNHEQRLLEPELIPDAREILNKWKEDRGDDADYIPSKESLDMFSDFDMRGAIYYINGKPVAYCLGEGVAGGTIFCIHFEKGLEQYKGIYQYMNQAFAASLDSGYTYINREQDLGNAGLRQAKMTYRPVAFVKKFKGIKYG